MNQLYPWQADDWARLQSLRDRAQGLLFQGLKGIGKLDLAINFARALLCQHPEHNGFSCGICPSCHWFEQQSHPDFRIIQPAADLEVEESEEETGKKASRQISVKQIRDLADFIGLSAHQGGRRVVIIHPAEAMNTNAANALLKNLEEPPAGLLFILVTHKPQSLLPTLLSRCLSINFSIPDIASSTQWLADQEIRDPVGALAYAGYSPLLAKLNASDASSQVRDMFLAALLHTESMDVFALSERLLKTEQVLVVQWLQQWSYDLLLQKLTKQVRYHPAQQAFIGQLVEKLEALNLARLQSYLQTAKLDAQHTLNPKLFFESLLFTYVQLTSKT
jgi:DNA polymerase-3 subunit delta'